MFQMTVNLPDFEYSTSVLPPDTALALNTILTDSVISVYFVRDTSTGITVRQYQIVPVLLNNVVTFTIPALYSTPVILKLRSSPAITNSAQNFILNQIEPTETYLLPVSTDTPYVDFESYMEGTALQRHEYLKPLPILLQNLSTGIMYNNTKLPLEYNDTKGFFSKVWNFVKKAAGTIIKVAPTVIGIAKIIAAAKGVRIPNGTFIPVTREDKAWLQVEPYEGITRTNRAGYPIGVYTPSQQQQLAEARLTTPSITYDELLL